MKNKNQGNFVVIFNSLKNIFKPFKKHLKLSSDKDVAFNLNAGYSEENKRDIYSGGAKGKTT